MEWSPQQEAAIKAVRAWLLDPSQQVFYLAGFAGSGKTTLAVELANAVRGRVLYAAFTGKAALVMRRKGCRNASTIHSLIYLLDQLAVGWEPTFVLNPNSEVRNAELVVIDECSMVGEDLARDLLSFGTKVLVLGDPAQLPPVNGTGYFTSGTPDFMLTEIHRQAADNPIIRLSMQVRQGLPLDFGDYGACRIIHRADVDQQDVVDADIVLVGLNKTRRAYNGRIRMIRGFKDPLPVVGDRLVCLRNKREKKILNGGLFDVAKITSRKGLTVKMHVTSDDHVERAPTAIKVRKEFFEGGEEDLSINDRRGTEEFTYGYALTIHKSQGSQWDNVYLFDESGAFREDSRRHLYTGITRAAERLTLVRPA